MENTKGMKQIKLIYKKIVFFIHFVMCSKIYLCEDKMESRKGEECNDKCICKKWR